MKGAFHLDVATLKHRFHLRMAEWANALAMLLCGVILLQPDATFDLLPYTSIREMLDEEAWGRIMSWLGGVRLLVLSVNGALRRGSPHMRWILSVLACVVWTFLLAGYLNSHQPSLMIAMTGTAMCAEFVNIARTAAAALNENEKCRSGGNGRRS